MNIHLRLCKAYTYGTMVGFLIQVCKDTFQLDTIVLVVNFIENYTLQPQNEVQEKYYTFQQVSIFFHITFMHSPTSTEDDMIL